MAIGKEARGNKAKRQGNFCIQNTLFMGYRFGKSERERLAAVERYLAANLHETVGVEKLCALAAMSRQKLNAGFVRFYGKPVQVYLLALRMQLARELLQTTEESIGAIAGATGYEHPGSLSRAYKRFYGITPMDERKKAMEANGDPPLQRE